MAHAKPFGINEWLIKAVQDRYTGDARQMLVLALARLVPSETACPILVSVFDDLPGHVSIALAEVGGAAELYAMQSRVDDLDGWQQKETLKAIRKIRRRLGKAQS